ncbi:MAG: histidine kinase, partial [Candidatus Brocadiaceae bacterium]
GFFPGKNHFDLYPHEENRRAFQRVLETGEPHFAHARPFHDSDRGDPTYWDWSLLPVKDEPGEVDGLLLCLVDVTEREQAVASIRAYQSELRSLASELILAEERERRRIATELHDQLGQTLAMSKIKLGAARSLASSEAVAGPVEETRQLLDQCIRYARSLTFELGSPVLSEVGLEAALEELAQETQKRHALQTEFETDGRPKPLDDDIRVLLFQAVRELLLNVVKHAGARCAKICIVRANGRVRVSVEDDGVGFDTGMLDRHELRTRGYGLFSIRERMDHMGGSFRISSEPQNGTMACLEAPLSDEPSDPDGDDDEHPHSAG